MQAEVIDIKERNLYVDVKYHSRDYDVGEVKRIISDMMAVLAAQLKADPNGSIALALLCLHNSSNSSSCAPSLRHQDCVPARGERDPGLHLGV